MDIKFVITTLKEKINCILIKVIEKDTNSIDSIINGLFKGIVSHKNKNEKKHTFILTEKLNKMDKYVIKGVNKEFYDILEIQIIGENNEVYIFATKNYNDQERIYEILKLCLESLVTNKMVLNNDDQIVDTTQYIKIPDRFIEKTKPKGNATGRYITAGRCNTMNRYKMPAQKIIKPTFFEFIPSNQNEIDKMKIKLNLVLNEQFIPKLPSVVTGEEEKPTNRGYNYSAMGYMYDSAY